MSGSDRSKGNPLIEWALPLIGIVIALLLAVGLGWLDGREAERRYQSPHRHAESAKANAKRACEGTEPEAVFECVYEKVEASENTAQTEQDLSAQQRAATSALASAIVALFTLVATIVGVWFVKRTLDATLEAVQDTSEATEAMRAANQIAHLGVRPWLKLESLNVRSLVLIGDEAEFTIEALFRNIGKTPAKLDVSPNMAGLVCRYPYNPAWAEDHIAETVGVKFYSGSESETVIFPDETYPVSRRFRTKIVDELIFPKGHRRILPEPQDWKLAESYIALAAISIIYRHAGGEGRTMRIAKARTQNRAFAKANGEVFVTKTMISERWQNTT